jgi:hypothetical protein
MEILPKEQRALWDLLAPTKDLGLTLYGGTAIALRLGHRISVDFDFFTDKPLEKDAIYKTLPFLSEAEVLQESKNTLVVSFKPAKQKNPVKLSFFGGMSFGRFGEPELTEDNVLRVASSLDLMGTKVKVLFDRVEQKDYDDLAAMIDAGSDLATSIAVAQGMFPGISPQVALVTLVYFEPLPGLGKKARQTLVNAAKSVDTLPEVHRLSTSLSNGDGDDGAGGGASGGPSKRKRKPR